MALSTWRDRERDDTVAPWVELALAVLAGLLVTAVLLASEAPPADVSVSASGQVWFDGRGLRDSAEESAGRSGHVARVPEVFREREGAWPIIGVQAHAERPVEFETAVAGEPASAVADPLLLVAAMYEEVVDAYARNAQLGASASSMFDR
ncbi:MAG: hypothetical protein ACHREM_20245 [Polyangiales bacterium]